MRTTGTFAFDFTPWLRPQTLARERVVARHPVDGARASGRGRCLGVPVRVEVLALGLEDPDGFLAALGTASRSD
jgi:hypothetical protein